MKTRDRIEKMQIQSLKPERENKVMTANRKCLAALLLGSVALLAGCKGDSAEVGVTLNDVEMQPVARMGRGWMACNVTGIVRSSLKQTVSEFEISFKNKILMNGSQEIVLTLAPETKIRKLFPGEDKEIAWVAASYQLGSHAQPQALRYGPATARDSVELINNICHSIGTEDFFLKSASCEADGLSAFECGAKVVIK